MATVETIEHAFSIFILGFIAKIENSNFFKYSHKKITFSIFNHQKKPIINLIYLKTHLYGRYIILLQCEQQKILFETILNTFRASF